MTTGREPLRLLEVALALGHRCRKRRKDARGRLGGKQAWKLLHVDLETPRIGKLRHETDVAKTGRRAECERARFAGNERLAGTQPLGIDEARPIENGILADAERAQ